MNKNVKGFIAGLAATVLFSSGIVGLFIWDKHKKEVSYKNPEIVAGKVVAEDFSFRQGSKKSQDREIYRFSVDTDQGIKRFEVNDYPHNSHYQNATKLNRKIDLGDQIEVKLYLGNHWHYQQDNFTLLFSEADVKRAR